MNDKERDYQEHCISLCSQILIINLTIAPRIDKGHIEKYIELSIESTNKFLNLVDTPNRDIAINVFLALLASGNANKTFTSFSTLDKIGEALAPAINQMVKKFTAN